MPAAKSVLGLISVLFPVLYCGGLLYYFLDVSGSVQEVEENGLGPTVLGLGIVGLLFCIPLVLKIVRMFARARSPGAGGPGGSPDEGGREAEAMIARYMAQRSAEAAGPGQPARLGGVPAGRPGFGRKVR